MRYTRAYGVTDPRADEYDRQAAQVRELERQAAQWMDAEVCMGTNEGTFGAGECCAKTGSGDPRYGNYTRYTTARGHSRVEGCDPEKAPGKFRANKNYRAELWANRAKADELKKRAKEIRQSLPENWVI